MKLQNYFSGAACNVKRWPRQEAWKIQQALSPAKAERLVQEELQKRGWTEAELMQRRKSDADKVRIAEQLRRETTMTLAWIA